MSVSPQITAAIPTIPPRATFFRKAVASVFAQNLKPVSIAAACDLDKEGSAVTRNRALSMVTTPWTAFLDDDDQWLANHLEKLHSAAVENDADVVYSLPRVMDRNGIRQRRQWDWGGGPVFDPELLRKKAHIQTTCLVKTDLAKSVGGFEFVTDITGALNDDHGFFLKLLDAGAKFHHVHEETFIWLHHGYGQPGTPGNTSGRPERWS
jgi:hypothetical protein